MFSIGAYDAAFPERILSAGAGGKAEFSLAWLNYTSAGAAGACCVAGAYPTADAQ
jgi:hypothetical protein